MLRAATSAAREKRKDSRSALPQRRCPFLCRLPIQLLVLVLKNIPQRRRLGFCAVVSKTWRTAAVMATNRITADMHEARDRVSLSRWLRLHAAAAAVDSIILWQMDYEPFVKGPPFLLLPVQHLAALRKLVIDHIDARIVGSPPSQGVIAGLVVELSALTHLSLHGISWSLSSLPALTELRHLELVHCGQVDTAEHWEAVAAALPRLQHLTTLDLAGSLTQDAFLSGMQQLTCLQELLLGANDEDCTAASFQALPVTLTKLRITAATSNLDLGPVTTPGLTQITALQWLEIQGLARFDAALLGSMPSLRHLILDTHNLAPAAAGGLSLSALSALTKLQHLQLPLRIEHLEAQPTPADVAALTTSSQLTYLDIGQGLVAQCQYVHMLPEGRQLPQLHTLRATMGLLASTRDVETLAVCCAQLKVLDLSTALDGEDSDATSLYYGRREQHSIALLGWPCRLTSLILNLENVQPTCTYWANLAAQTSLRSLELFNLDWAYCGGIIDLTACTQLTNLRVVHQDHDCPSLILKTGSWRPEPDVWRQLPHAAMESVMQYYADAPCFGWDQQAALHSLARATAGRAVALDFEMQHKNEELQQEVKDLRATVAALQQREQEQQQLRQEVADLRATVAALLQPEQQRQGSDQQCAHSCQLMSSNVHLA